MEKGIIKALINDWDEINYADIRDALRAMLACGTKDTSFAEDTAVAAKAQGVVYGGEALPPRRSKCRLVGKSVTEWRDELINVLVTTGKHQLLGEIQIVRSKMLMQRESMGGHDGYDESRGLRGLLDAMEACGFGGGGGGGGGGSAGATLTKKGQKTVEKLIAKRDATIAKANAKATTIRAKANAKASTILAKATEAAQALNLKVLRLRRQALV